MRGHCRPMPADKEQLCCRGRRKCRSRTAAFQNICTDGDNPATVITSLADTYVFTSQYDNRVMRHAAYRQYVMWQHGHLARGHRKVIHHVVYGKLETIIHLPIGNIRGIKTDK